MFVAFMKASLSYTQAFVFYFINALCLVELVNKKKNVFIFTCICTFITESIKKKLKINMHGN